MITKVLAYIKEYHMLQPGDKVAVGVSGGADSVCLLFMLLKMRESIPIELTAVHVNHKIRPEAGEDATFVEALCKEWGCRYRYVEADVENYAREKHISTEEAGRQIRYEAFEQALQEMSAAEASTVAAGEAKMSAGGQAASGKIAVAHNQNDNAETVLFHLMRGSGLDGLAGIRPVRGNVIRPLLCVTRAEIEAFLEKWGISYCIDRTNHEDTYTRNRIRHHILPYAESEICKGAVSHIYDTSVIIEEASAYIRKNAEAALKRCEVMPQKTSAERVLEVEAFRKEEAFLQKQVLLLALEKAAGSRKDLGAVHIRALHQLFLREGNGQCSLPYGLTAVREYGRVRIISGKKAAELAGTGQEVPTVCELLIPGETEWGDGRVFSCSIFPYEKNQIIPQKTYTKWFDYDKIVKSLVLRTRQTGDYLEIRQDGSRKTLKSYLIDEKVPRTERDRLPVLADGNHILWIVGMRISEHYKINENTKTVLQIQVIGGTSDGRED